MKRTIAGLVITGLTWLLMLPLGSFILDPALLLIIGVIIVFVSVRLLGRFLPPRYLIPILAVLTIAVFYLGSLSLYFNLPQADVLHRFAALFPFMRESPSGFNFMINSGILSYPYISPEEAPFTLHLFSGFLFTLYPLWLFLGIRLGSRMVGAPRKQKRRRRTIHGKKR